MQGDTETKSGYSRARDIARRLAREGEQPYADDREQYLVLEGARAGEVIEFGRPLRDHRMFPVKSRSKLDKLAEQFEGFAAAEGIVDWCLWTVCRPTRKTITSELEEDYRQFNSDLNVVLSDLRKRCSFEPLLIGIHVRFDPTTNLFDLHAHFVCRVARSRREEARRRLMTAFSRCHLPDDSIRSVQGVARYIGRTFKLEEVIQWPKDALLAAWRLGGKRFHYTRTAGRFAAYRSAISSAADPTRRRRPTRTDPRHPDRDFEDRRLVRRSWRFGDEEVEGTLYLRGRPRPVPESAPMPPPYYTSTDVATSQADRTTAAAGGVNQSPPVDMIDAPAQPDQGPETTSIPATVPSPAPATRQATGQHRAKSQLKPSVWRFRKLVVGGVRQILSRLARLCRRNE